MGEGTSVVNVLAWFTDPADWTGPNGIPIRTLQRVVISGTAMIIALAIAVIGLRALGTPDAVRGWPRTSAASAGPCPPWPC